MNLTESIQEFLEWRSHQNKARATFIQNASNLRQFAIFMRNCPIEDVTERDILLYFSLIEKDFGVQSNTMIPKVNALRQLFKYWNQRNFRTMNYELIPLRQKEFTFPKLCTHEDLEKFCSFAFAPSSDSRRLRNAAIIALIATTGIRNGEAGSIMIENVNTSVPSIKEGDITMFRAVIKTEKTRGMKPFREIFWDVKTNEIIAKWIARRNDIINRHPFKEPRYLFVGLNSKFGEAGWGKKLTPNAIDEIFRIYSKKSGVKIRPHMLRHLLGRDMAESDASDHVISDVLGHSRLDSSRTYTRLFGKAVAKQFYRFRGASQKGNKELTDKGLPVIS